ncbi:MAG: type VII secretion protein EccE [Pseudonocardiaceae bacterium]
MANGVDRWIAVDRTRVVTVAAALGWVLAGVGMRGPSGAALIGLGVLLLAAALLRRQGRWASDRVMQWLLDRDSVVSAGSQRGDPQGDSGLGAVSGLLPQLHIVEARDRRNPPIATVGDGPGYAAVLEVHDGPDVRLPLTELVSWATGDAAGLAGVQVLVEQTSPVDVGEDFGPAIAYRRLPTNGLPLVVRTWIVLRHEPLRAVQAAAARGGGALGARTALVAATARLRVRLAELGVRATALSPAALRELLPMLGDPASVGEIRPEMWVTSHRGHCCLLAEVSSSAAWSAVLRAASGAQRSVVSLTVDCSGAPAGSQAVVRLVARDPEQLERARSTVVGTGHATPLLGKQGAGVVATLPLGAEVRVSVAAVEGNRKPGNTERPRLDPPAAGVFLGTSRDSAPVAVTAVAARPLRLGLVGGIDVARVLACRILGAGCHLTVATARREAWRPLQALAGAQRLTVVEQRASWPPVPGQPPNLGHGPQVLLVDLPDPPPRWVGRSPWCTVVHAVARVPVDAEFWATVDEVLVGSRGHGEVLARLLGNREVVRADELGAGEIALCARRRVVLGRLLVAPSEADLVS